MIDEQQRTDQQPPIELESEPDTQILKQAKNGLCSMTNEEPKPSEEFLSILKEVKAIDAKGKCMCVLTQVVCLSHKQGYVRYCILAITDSHMDSGETIL